MNRLTLDRWATRAFGSAAGQRLLGRVSRCVARWQGYGSGADVDDSGEDALFDLVRASRPRGSPLVVADIGANVGKFTDAALRRLGASACVHAFEPARGVFEQNSRRFAGDARVVVNNLALGRSAGQMPLFGTARDTGMASLLRRDLKQLGADVDVDVQETVRVERLDAYCDRAGLSRIDLMKMDVEGFELEVLAGAEALFAKGAVGLCSFEFGGCNVDSRTFLRDFFGFFGSHGMRISRITPTGTLVALPAYHERLECFANTNYVARRAHEGGAEAP